jgi:hypothetical protein
LGTLEVLKELLDLNNHFIEDVKKYKLASWKELTESTRLLENTKNLLINREKLVNITTREKVTL